MRKDIVIVANFCRDFSNTDNGRFMYLCKELAKDHDVEIITSDFSHILKRHKDELTNFWPFKITFLHEPGYKKNISLKRFFSHYFWGKEVSKYLKKRKKPDVVYCSVPSLSGPMAAANYCKKNNVRLIVDIQDLWPEAFKMVLNIPIISNMIFAPFSIKANSIYKRADAIVAVSDTYLNRALSVNKKCKKSMSVYLGTRLETFDENVKNNPVDKPLDEIWLAYCGTLGASYDLTCVFDALEIIRNKGMIPPKFIVMGDGTRKSEFESYARKKNLDVLFTGRLPYDKMCAMLSKCDFAVNPISGGAAQSIINKHGDYASAGMPVLNTQESPEYRNLVTDYEMGFNCENNNAIDLADKMIVLMLDKDLRCKMSKNARYLAEKRFDRKNSYPELVEMIVGDV